jgi:exosortase
LYRLWVKTNPIYGEANWSHSILVPIVGLYFLFVHRDELLAADGLPFVWGRFLRPGRLFSGLGMIAFGGLLYTVFASQSGNLADILTALGKAVGLLGTLAILLDWSLGTTLFGLIVFVYGIYPGQNDYLKDMGMILTLFGIVLLTGGRQIMRIAWFPIVFLICAIPWPGLVYSWVTEPLSQVAARVAVEVLQTVGIDAGVNGTKIVINTVGKPQRTLNVAEACAGLRSLMTFISVAATIAFLSPRPLWQKLVVVASAVPIAIICNMTRISGVAILDRVNSNWTEGFAHQFVGLVMLIPAGCMMAIVLWALNRIFIEEADEKRPAVAAAGIVVKKPVAAVITKPVAAVATKPAPAAVVTEPADEITKTPAAAPVIEPAAAAILEKPPAAPVAPVRPSVAAVPPAPLAPKAAAPPPARTAPAPAKPAAVVPPRPAGIVPPRPATARPPAVRPPGAPASAGVVPPRPVQAGTVPPRPVPPARPPAAGAAGAVTPGRPPAPRAIVPPRPHQPVVPPKPTQETP